MVGSLHLYTAVKICPENFSSAVNEGLSYYSCVMTSTRPRLSEVAARAGVSEKTVSNVINKYPHVTPATRAKVEAALTDLNYKVNLSARSLASGRTGFIAF